MRNAWWLCVVMCLQVGVLAAQTVQVSGRVYDAEDGSLIPGAQVFLQNTKYGSATDRNGQYLIKNIEPGTYQLAAFAYGYLTSTMEVKLTGDLKQDFRLGVLADSLDAVVVQAEREKSFGMVRLRSVEGTAIYEAKKTEVVVISELAANMAANTSRQIYAKVAGLNIWESDGAGVQLGIGGRGLSPNRTSNFNTRQNGYDIAADALGYPESYYTPPVQALERIEIVRGAASLQYGTQFGGMLNFRFKEGPRDKRILFTSMQSVGSFGLFNSFNSVGGTVGKVNYYSFYNYKRSDGWRPNSSLEQHTAYASANWQMAPELNVRLDFTHMNYLAHQPGGLTDAQFEQDPRQSNRERNWFKVDWNLAALQLNYQFSERTTLNSRFFGLLAGRDALGNLGRIDRIDDLGNRNLLSDDFSNWGNETRLIHKYELAGKPAVFLIGTRWYDGFTHRMQGDANDGYGPDFQYLNPDDLEGSDFDLPSANAAAFVEHIVNFSNRFSITPGLRFEYIDTQADGFYKETQFRFDPTQPGNLGDTTFRIDESNRNQRAFLLGGLGLSYKPSESLEFYSNFSQNYRAINFNDIRVDNPSLEVDENLKDERGFNIDLGTRGEVTNLLNFDLSLFYLNYSDRIGNVLRTEPDPRFNNLVDRTFRLRTNIADARILGLESYVELDVIRLLYGRNFPYGLSFFSNLAFIDSKYVNSQENGVDGNEVELVPHVNLKAGATLSRKNFKATWQYTYVSQQYSDASNADTRVPTAVEGIIPAYQVMDFSLSYFYKWLKVQAGVNNLSNEIYFTRRAAGYPGPGIIPSDGRSFYLTLGVKF